MNKIFYIENTIDEYRTKIVGFFETLDEAKEALKECCNWYESKGTGYIYSIEFGLHKYPKLEYRN